MADMKKAMRILIMDIQDIPKRIPSFTFEVDANIDGPVRVKGMKAQWKNETRGRHFRGRLTGGKV